MKSCRIRDHKANLYEELTEKSPQSQMLMKNCRLSLLAVNEALYKAPAADEHFQEIAKEAHERNKRISSPYEHEDVEQYIFAFEGELEQNKKEIIKDTKRLTALIKDKTPSKEYIGHRKRLLDGDDSEKVKKDYDEYAIFELEQYIDDIKANNADKCILGYYEDRALLTTRWSITLAPRAFL
jgi:hypothetical protein